MQIVRELADEGNPIAKIAFLTRLAESTVREILAQLLAPTRNATISRAPEARPRPVLLSRARAAAATGQARRIAA